ncbi:formate dehydrogenase accessory sulfurtransferase FdhD [Bradyrhizobium canariense]|uniref:Sulfur carrier protein FdhD n=1 Tax=Bradyrhizobium canariense TaxID=255045 RepID=A0A1X3GCT5_9BRAD|nr:formate dehydrogenase accessory sulfurtransferase FdhD [Bradyrhizobium canariense]OSI65525.1 sulfurtransferase FdhD [Bradyrhizobium canariense]OSI76030.1 sulfurtransferase FdhD [Bradyrhizobium canariense]OSI85676.1 sulfurtransferase FdhD [Bradyrhizobium canariense]OSI87182.1 sulfurtransferase FdhD [Bradyrhizobium canariense]OSI99619.1 sulfurtransferase FdhD [Bradyrhizobium canariense]
MQDRCTRDKPELVWRGRSPIPSSRKVAEERPIALTYNGSTYAVMMASPVDLMDFGVGFSLSEGIVEHGGDIISIEVVELELGCEVRIWLDDSYADLLANRRRAMVGPVGCGMCGIESLEQACPRPTRVVSEGGFRPFDLLEAMRSLRPLQHHNQATGAMHAAAFWDGHDIRLVREDVGRHNALDKLAGAAARAGLETSRGAVLITSRVSVELVQKTARMGVPLLIAVSAPTSLAIETAERAGVTLVGVARDDGYEIFSHAGRLIFGEEDLESAALAGSELLSARP